MGKEKISMSKKPSLTLSKTFTRSDIVVLCVAQ